MNRSRRRNDTQAAFIRALIEAYQQRGAAAARSMLVAAGASEEQIAGLLAGLAERFGGGE